MKYVTAFSMIFIVGLALGTQAQDNIVWWGLTVDEVRQEDELKDVFMSSYFPAPGETFLVVETTLTDTLFDASASLPDSKILLQGVHLYEGAVPANIHGFSLADVSLMDGNGEAYALYAFLIGSDVLIAPNLTDFSVAAPYEEVGYSFVFAVPAEQIEESFTLIFDKVAVAEISVDEEAILLTGGESVEDATEEPVALPTETPSAAATQTPSAAATDQPTVTPLPTETPIPSATPPSLLMNISTAASFAIYTQPTTNSERLIAAAESFSPHVVGANADYSWVYVYFFMETGLTGGWLRSNQITLDETALQSLPIIDPANPPVLPILEFDESAVPVHLREAVILAMADANAIHEIYLVWNPNGCFTSDGSIILEGDTVYITLVNFELTQEAAEAVVWAVRVGGKLLSAEQVTYVVEADIQPEGGEWVLPYRITTYAAWTAEEGNSFMRGTGRGHGVQSVSCSIEVEPRP
jgi:hypothetical protein